MLLSFLANLAMTGSRVHLGKHSHAVLGQKESAETLCVWFDFISLLSPGESVALGAVEVAVYSGTDPAPRIIASGSALVEGSRVGQLLTGGIPGVTYEITATAQTSGASLLSLIGFLTIP